MEHGEGIPGPHVGGNRAFFLSGRRGRNPFATGSASRAANGGLGWARMPRLSMRSLWIPKAARTDHVPLPVGSQARPTRGCNNSLAWFVSKHEFPTTVSVEITKFLSHL